jgi:hypothetical protein
MRDVTYVTERSPNATLSPSASAKRGEGLADRLDCLSQHVIDEKENDACRGRG